MTTLGGPPKNYAPDPIIPKTALLLGRETSAQGAYTPLHTKTTARRREHRQGENDRHGARAALADIT